MYQSIYTSKYMRETIKGYLLLLLDECFLLKTIITIATIATAINNMIVNSTVSSEVTRGAGSSVTK